MATNSYLDQLKGFIARFESTVVHTKLYYLLWVYLGKITIPKGCFSGLDRLEMAKIGTFVPNTFVPNIA